MDFRDLHLKQLSNVYNQQTRNSHLYGIKND